VRAVIDGKQFPALAAAVRKCCTQHREQKLKVGLAKRQAELQGDVAA
jgi:hypothetical protein